MLNYENLIGRLFLFVVVFVGLQSCGAYMHQPMQQREARFGEVTPTNQLLKELPEPKDKTGEPASSSPEPCPLVAI